MSDKFSKKINVDNDSNENDQVEVKKSPRFSSREKRKGNVEEQIADFYKSSGSDHLQKPIRPKGLLFLVIIWAIVFGLIAGTGATLLLLSRESLELPFIGEIELNNNFSTREIVSVTEKNVTVLAEARREELIQEIESKTGAIFEVKNSQELGFLDQIYAPWQRKGVGVFINSLGWVMTSATLEPDKEYLFLDQERNLHPFTKIVVDSVTGISFCQFSGQDFPEISLALKEEVRAGQEVVIWDKLENKHFSKVNSPAKRNVFQTQDLINSTDYFSDYLALDRSASLAGFPQGLVFGLDKKIIGVIMKERVIPAWQISPIFKQVLLGQDIERPYLGIDYLRIEQAPGLQSDKFKDLKNGAIVYGSPVENSPALASGLQNADVIIRVDNVFLDEDQDLTYLIQQKIIGDEVELTILREGQEIILRPVLAPQP